MNNLQEAKTVWVTEPGAVVDNTAFTTAAVDCKGFSRARIVIGLGATDIALAALSLNESDDSGMSNSSAVPGTDFSVSPLTLPDADDDKTLYAIHLNLSGRKRYLDVSLTAGNGSAGTYAVVWADLYGGQVAPVSAEGRGFAQEAVV